jgi:hypothetical protein
MTKEIVAFRKSGEVRKDRPLKLRYSKIKS